MSQNSDNSNSVIFTIIITLLIIGSAGFIFYIINRQNAPKQIAIQNKLEELKQSVKNNQDLKLKIIDLEKKIDTLIKQQKKQQQESQKQNFLTYKNNHYLISIKYPPKYVLCLNKDCDSNVEDDKIDFIKIQPKTIIQTINNQQQKTKDLDNYIVKILIKKNDLNELAIEYGQKIKDLNKKKGSFVENTDKINLFNNLLVYQFDVKDKLFLNEDENPIELKGIYRIMYFDYNDFYYRIMYPINNPDAEKIVQNISLLKKEQTNSEKNKQTENKKQ